MRKNNEKWEPIIGYEGVYEISNRGRVKSLSRKEYNGFGYFIRGELIRKIQLSEKGYGVLKLTKNKITKNHKLHRLVAEHFIPNPNNYKTVNHKDENKLNNNVGNLEWCTQQYNLAYGNTRLRQSEGQNIPVYKCDMLGDVLKRYDSMLDTKCDGFNNGSVSRCCNGKQDSHKGYKWRYADE